MDDREWTIVALVAGAALQVVFALLVKDMTWPLIAQIALLMLPTVLLVGFFVSRRRLRARHTKRADTAAAPSGPVRLADVIQRGWFVSFTDDPNPHNEGGKPLYATAIAEVEALADGDVVLSWRDNGNFPTRVPIALLEANQVRRHRANADGEVYVVRTGNTGLSFGSPGGVSVGRGWSAHPWPPAGPFVRRWSTLDEDHRAAMEVAAALDTYLLEDL